MTTLAAGFGERVINPPFGADLCGYGFYLDRKAAFVLDDLKVRALFLSDGEAGLMLIACDLVGLSVEFSDRLRARIAAALGLPIFRILLACTHTHSGPATQSMTGLGEVDSAFMDLLAKKIVEAAEEAAADPRPAELRSALEAVEPIGFNRRTNDFRGIDPWLKAAVFKTKRRRIFLLNYSCHAVVLGRGTGVSADWPGAWIRKVERGGDMAIFFQGFCGDIDPVTQLNRWGEGTPEDLEFYGDLLKRRLDKAEAFATIEDRPALAAAETRIRVPLNVWSRREIEREAESFRKAYENFPGAERFSEEWRTRALECFREMRKTPFLESVPLQAMSVGRLRLLALPGEVFCGIGLNLRKAFAPLVTIGYANGYIGYIPSREAYRNRTDYACYFAPMFTQVFPFTPEIEGLIVRESRRILKSI